jgi:hypothetical protein
MLPINSDIKQKWSKNKMKRIDDTVIKQLSALMDTVSELRRRIDEYEIYLQYEAPKKKHGIEQALMTFRELVRG